VTSLCRVLLPKELPLSQISEQFERQIKRIHELIKQPGSEVTWNDHIPDPDNPEQPRQIDISINRDDKLTLVECRIHKKRQDVKWIEELIGRKLSLRSDAIIAVSASGFTKGAILKANAHGVIIRDVMSLTEQEISHWGKKTKFSITFFKYEQVSMEFIFDAKFQGDVTVDNAHHAMEIHNSEFIGMFNEIAKSIRSTNPRLKPCELNARLSTDKIKINDIPIIDIIFQANFSTEIITYNTPSVVAYDTPETNSLQRNVYIEQVELGQFEIMQSTDNVSVTLDLSQIPIRTNCLFNSVNFDFTRPVSLDSVNLIGPPKMGIPLSNFTIGIKFMQNPE